MMKGAMSLEDIIKIVVADDNDIIRQMVVDTLSDEACFSVVGQAADGECAVELIKKERPDIVLLDLVMPRLDGMSVMDKIKNSRELNDYSPEYIILSAAGREEIISEALNKGASYFMMKPFDGEALIKRIKYIASGKTQENSGESDIVMNEEYSTGTKIVELLRSIGVPVKMVGYKYLRDAIEIAIKAPDVISVTKDIYPAVAQIHETSSGNVERNIRYVIETTWTKHEAPPSEIFADTVKRPTNTEFILNCSEYIKLKYNLKNE